MEKMAMRDFPIRNLKELERMKHKKKEQQEETPAPRVLWQPLTYSDNTLPSHVLAGLHKQWTEGMFLDVTVKVDDVSIKAHKNVLYSLGQYFEVRFTTAMNDFEQNEIELHGLNPDAVQKLIEFAYTGSLEITQENIQDLLATANFLCIDPVIESCCSYLESNLSCENCVEILELATSLDQHKLQKNIESFMSINFEEFVRDGHFLKMPVEALIQLLERDDLVIVENGFCLPKMEQEMKVLRVILSYVKENPTFTDHLPELLSRCVRLVFLPQIENLDPCSWITPDCLKLLGEMLSEPSKEDKERWEHPRLCNIAIEYEKTKVLAGTTAIQSEVPSEPFDDIILFHEEKCVYVTGMVINIRRWDGRPVVGGIKVFYSNGGSVSHASTDYGHENHEFHLEPGERIVSINARTGWMIDQLQFLTSSGKEIGPFGGPGGGLHRLLSPCDGAYLAYLTGKVDVAENLSVVRKLRFVWGNHKCLS